MIGTEGDKDRGWGMTEDRKPDGKGDRKEYERWVGMAAGRGMKN